jgi:hypothetical protein
VIIAAPEKSNRQIAEQVKVSQPTVAAVRADLETKGDVEKVSTSVDTRGRRQQAHKPKRKRPAPHNTVQPAHAPSPYNRFIQRLDEREREIRERGGVHRCVPMATILEEMNVPELEELTADVPNRAGVIKAIEQELKRRTGNCGDGEADTVPPVRAVETAVSPPMEDDHGPPAEATWQDRVDDIADQIMDVADSLVASDRASFFKALRHEFDTIERLSLDTPEADKTAEAAE